MSLVPIVSSRWIASIALLFVIETLAGPKSTAPPDFGQVSLPARSSTTSTHSGRYGAVRAAWATPFHTRGSQVVDALGKPVRFACVNWYGAHLKQMVMNGLNKQPMRSIASHIASLGFNCVRLPFSLEMVLGNFTRVPFPSPTLDANPHLKSSSPLEVFDETVDALTAAGILVILNNHISSAGWCCSVNDGEGLWYTEKYPESDWLDVLGLMTARYKSNPLVVGFDLRNELRPSRLGSPTWGDGDPKTDWAIAAQKGSERVLSENKDMLLIISGLRFGAFLCEVPEKPLHLFPRFRGRMLYTAHEYPWTSYHLLASRIIVGCLSALAIWCGILALTVVALGVRRYRRSKNGLERGTSCRCCHLRNGEETVGNLTFWERLCKNTQSLSCLARPASVCELIVALLLTGLSIVVLLIWHNYGSKCGFSGMVSDMAACFLTLVCGFVSLTLWMRIALAFAKQAHLAPQQQLEPSSDPELYPPPFLHGELSLQRLESVPFAGVRIVAPRSGKHKRWTTLTSSLGSWNCLVLMLLGILLGALVWVASRFGTYEQYVAEVNERWGFLISHGAAAEAANVAPVWIGEFGTDKQDLWWSYALRYMKDRNASFAYWALNGEKNSWGKQETYGILRSDSITIRYNWMVEELHELLNARAVEL